LDWWTPLGYSDRVMFCLFMLLSHHLVFYSISITTGIISHFNLFSSYRIQKDKWAKMSLIKDCTISSLISHFIAQPLLMYFILYPFFVFCGLGDIRAPVPSPLRLLAELAISFLICETQYYWAHRWVHANPILYQYIHKKHHMFHVNTGANAEYATLAEDILLNYSSALLGPMLVGSHPIVIGAFVALRIWESLEVHSGYDLPFPLHFFGLFSLIHGGARYHDYHHSNNVGNFGILRIWDRLMGTDVHFNKAEQQRKASTRKAA